MGYEKMPWWGEDVYMLCQKAYEIYTGMEGFIPETTARRLRPSNNKWIRRGNRKTTKQAAHGGTLTLWVGEAGGCLSIPNKFIRITKSYNKRVLLGLKKDWKVIESPRPCWQRRIKWPDKLPYIIEALAVAESEDITQAWWLQPTWAL